MRLIAQTVQTVRRLWTVRPPPSAKVKHTHTMITLFIAETARTPRYRWGVLCIINTHTHTHTHTHANSSCKECGGVGICQHNRQRNSCRDWSYVCVCVRARDWSCVCVCVCTAQLLPCLVYVCVCVCLCVCLTGRMCMCVHA